MKITYDKLQTFLEAWRQYTDDRVKLYPPKRSWGREGWLINWSSFGAVSLEEALEFSSMLNLGIEIVSNLNNNNVSIISGDDTIDSDLRNKEDYLRALSQLSRWFKSYDYMNVIDWLEYKG